MSSRFFKLLMACVACALLLTAHPMGNFSVSHYSKLQVSARGVELEYALDLAEIPTSALLSSWNLERTAPQSELESRANQQAREWLKGLSVEIDSRPVQPVFQSSKLVIADGAGGLPILRITTLASVSAHGGLLTYEDHNFPDRTGWKEIVVDQGTGATLTRASQTSRDISHALTQYPADPLIAPPQDLRAEVAWSSAPVMAAAPVVKAIPQPKPAFAAAAPATMTAAGAPAGAVVKGDFLSRLLHQRELTSSLIFLAIGAAFLLGSAHALTPGHGKAIVAAYLVGSRGTMRHAAFLGATVTFTHTITVFMLGFATLFLSRFIVPEKITEWLGAVSGLSIVAVGAWMLMKRLRPQKKPHVHSHEHAHAHEHSHSHDHGHTHTHGGHSHSHSHVPDEISWKGLTALGISGGLVPCESALVLLLGAIALNRVAFGLVLLLSFSLGLATVLVVIGMMVLYARNLLPADSPKHTHPLLRWATIASPAIVMIVGIVMTGVALGWIQSKWLI
jgi:ABC-type nickel/cobalt efflux system permease component RcnA